MTDHLIETIRENAEHDGDAFEMAVRKAAEAWHYAQPVYRTNWHGDREVIPFEDLPESSIATRLTGMRAALRAVEKFLAERRAQAAGEGAKS